MIIENGIPKEYFDNGKLQFIGQYSNGKRWNGKIYNKDGIEKSEIKNGKGWGREFYFTGEKLFDGNYLYGLRNGKGREYFQSKTEIKPKFEGNYKNGLRNGEGIEYYDNGKIRFEGKYLNGLKNEKVIKYYYNTGDFFIGIYKNGIEIEGEFPYNFIHNNLELKDNKGEEYYDNENIHFVGEYFQGRKWNGILYNYSGEKEFELKNGKGKGKEYDYYGNLIYEGEYLNGKRWKGKGKEYHKNE